MVHKFRFELGIFGIRKNELVKMEHAKGIKRHANSHHDVFAVLLFQLSIMFRSKIMEPCGTALQKLFKFLQIDARRIFKNVDVI